MAVKDRTYIKGQVVAIQNIAMFSACAMLKKIPKKLFQNSVFLNTEETHFLAIVKGEEIRRAFTGFSIKNKSLNPLWKALFQGSYAFLQVFWQKHGFIHEKPSFEASSLHKLQLVEASLILE